MIKILMKKFKESIIAVFPITIIALLIGLLMGIFSLYMIVNFLIGSILLIFGMSFFTIGSEISIMTIGEKIGSYVTKKNSIFLILIVSLIIGSIITIAEPDLSVLAKQINSIDTSTFVLCVGIGAGIFLLIGTIRILFQIKISYVLLLTYFIVFLLSFFVPDDYIAIAFDSGGVTTGAMSVSFIIALGIGIASIKSGKSSKEDSFGLIGICSIGPVIAVLLLGLFYGTGSSSASNSDIISFNSFFEIMKNYFNSLLNYMLEVAIVLFPIILVFTIFQVFFIKIGRKRLIKIIKGFIYTYFGLVLFLVGVNVGFLPVGYLLGSKIAIGSLKYLLIPIGMLIGYVVVVAEPAVLVLVNQVEISTNGNIKKSVMKTALSIGVAISIGLSMFRLIFEIPIFYFLLPLYLIAIILAFIVPTIFTSIAFDSGGISSGTMTAAFLLPFSIGASASFGGNAIASAFGVVAIASTFPIVTVQLIGLIYKIKIKRASKLLTSSFDESIVDYEVDNYE